MERIQKIKYPIKQMLKDFWVFGKVRKKEIWFYISLVVIVAALQQGPVYLSGKIIDFLTTGEYTYVWPSIITMIIMWVVLLGIDNYQKYHVYVLSKKIRNVARVESFKRIFEVPMEHYDKNNSQDLIERVRFGTESLRVLVRVMLGTILKQIFIIAFSLAIIISLDITAAMGIILFTIIFFFYVNKVSEKRVYLKNKAVKEKEKNNSQIIEYISNIKLVKTLFVAKPLIKKLSFGFDKVLEKDAFAQKYVRTNLFWQKAMINLADVVMLGYLSFRVINHHITIGEAVIIQGLFSRNSRSIKEIWTNLERLIEAKTGFYRLSKVFELKKEKQSKFTPKLNGELIFEDVWFQYPTRDKASLKGINLTILKGERLAVLGHSGSGKSTIAKLIAKLYTPQIGNIKLHKRNLKDYDLSQVLRIVPQENKLINASIAENLRLVGEFSKEEIITALKQASAWSFISHLPLKEETIIGPGGIDLSGGQIQRICIARALISRPKILILDEATSNLDKNTEKEILQNLLKLPKDMTIMAITHRVESIKGFDRKIILEEGRIIAN